VRVGIQAGIPFGACFWKYMSPATPYGERFIVTAGCAGAGRAPARWRGSTRTGPPS
jgi:hypothetical protein